MRTALKDKQKKIKSDSGMQRFLFVRPSIKSQPRWSPFSPNAKRTLKWQTVGEWSVWLIQEFANSRTTSPVERNRERDLNHPERNGKRL